MRKAASWSGRVVQTCPRSPPHLLPSSGHRLPPQTSNPSRSCPRRPRRSPRMPSAAISPCCSVTSWIRHAWPASSTPKSGARWCGPIKRPAPRWSPALKGISPSISAMACSSTSATPWRTKMMPSGRCGPGWVSWRRWGNSIPAWGGSGGCTWWCAWGSTPGWWWWVIWGKAPGGNSWRSAKPPTWRPACKGLRHPIPW